MATMNTPISPIEFDEMFRRTKTQSMFQSYRSSTRPRSQATEMSSDTDFEDDSESGDDDYSSKPSFDSGDPKRSSQTTISSYDEVPTPNSSSSRSLRRPANIQMKSIEGPKGPHLFRSSQSSAELSIDYSMQMSPLLPKETPLRTDTAFSDQTITHVGRVGDFSIAAALAAPEADYYSGVDQLSQWSPQQVIDWMYHADVDASTIERFDVRGISGAMLMHLEFSHLQELEIPINKRNEIWGAICRLRETVVSPQPTVFRDVSRPCTTDAALRYTTSQPTVFQDTSRPCTTNTAIHQSKFSCESSSAEEDAAPNVPAAIKKRRARKAPKTRDVITPAESVSIVAIEQLIPKPHYCSKGDRCAKTRKQKRELDQMHEEYDLRWPISPTHGGRIVVTGNPGNAVAAESIIPNIHLLPEEPFRPLSDAIPSVIASSGVLSPRQLPDMSLDPNVLNMLGNRDPQDNVRQFLNFQHMQSPVEESPPTPPSELASLSTPGSIPRSGSVPLFPDQHHQAYPLQTNSYFQAPNLHDNLRSLPRLEIPRSATAAPALRNNHAAQPASAVSSRRDSDAIYRIASPASAMDVPVSAFPTGPIARDASQSVPPSMQFRPQAALSRSQSTRAGVPDWRRPSMTLPAVNENEVFSPASDGLSRRPSARRTNSSGSGSSANSSPEKQQGMRDPAHHSPTVKQFNGYGEDCTRAGWMKKRKTRMLRNEWQDAHCRLKGTQLAIHSSARLSSAATDTIDVDHYRVLASSLASTNKLNAAMKALHISDPKKSDPAAFAFQLVPNKDGDRKAAASGKIHHFAVKTKDERIDWMRDLMLKKVLQQKGEGYEVEVNGKTV